MPTSDVFTFSAADLEDSKEIPPEFPACCVICRTTPYSCREYTNCWIRYFGEGKTHEQVDSPPAIKTNKRKRRRKRKTCMRVVF